MLDYLILLAILLGILGLLFWVVLKINLWFIGKAAKAWKANS